MGGEGGRWIGAVARSDEALLEHGDDDDDDDARSSAGRKYLYVGGVEWGWVVGRGRSRKLLSSARSTERRHATSVGRSGLEREDLGSRVADVVVG